MAATVNSRPSRTAVLPRDPRVGKWLLSACRRTGSRGHDLPVAPPFRKRPLGSRENPTLLITAPLWAHVPQDARCLLRLAANRSMTREAAGDIENDVKAHARYDAATLSRMLGPAGPLGDRGVPTWPPVRRHPRRACVTRRSPRAARANAPRRAPRATARAPARAAASARVSVPAAAGAAATTATASELDHRPLALTTIPRAAAQAPTSSLRIAAAISPGNASGVHANDGTPSAASLAASAWS
jgi:hypothetical protein